MERESIVGYIRRLVLQSGMTGKLIAVNTAVFLIFGVLGLIQNLSVTPVEVAPGQFVPGYQFATVFKSYFVAPGDPAELLYKPWSVFTHMFLHDGFGHYLFNMIMLYFSGKIFVGFFGERRLLSTYLLGGLFAYGMHLLAYNLFPALAAQGAPGVLGASAAIAAIFIAPAVHEPGFKVHLFGVVQMPLFVIAGLYVISNLVGIGDGGRVAYVAHLGGALFGALSVINVHSSKNFMNRFDRFIFKLKFKKISFKRKPKMKVYSSSQARNMTDDEYNAQKQAKQARIDAILEKISKKGYDGLTREEKDILFNESKR